MVDVTGSRDCGNSPKNAFAQAVGVAIESGEFLHDAFTADMIWESPNGEVHGSDAIIAALAKVEKPDLIVVEHAITHGKVGATSGVATLASGHKRRFSHVIEFVNTKANKIARVKTYA
ncbi:nuclear transport factor 2 family protein [Shimia ponticola]|uniref:nuclear transport factor 2 family protein n=1 Tax=Shimia ponticola TaxID=2582893 RepID=UPI0011BDE8AA|nr:nuclear transport factor 2 family protein [Shimia ponticola]